MIQSLLLTAAILTGAIEVEVQTLDGQKTAGRLTQLDGKQIAIESAAGPQTFEVGKLVAVAVKSEQSDDPVKAQAIVELVDDSRILAKGFSTLKGQAAIELASGSKITVATKAIRFVRFVETSPTQTQLAKQWDEIVNLKLAGDLIVVRKKGALDYTEGLLGDIDAENINFKLDDDNLPVARSKVEAVLYYRATNPELREPQCVVHLRDGSHLAVAEIQLSDETIATSTPAGAKVELPIESLSRLDYSIGKVQYLSDMEAELTEVTPYFDAPNGVASYSGALMPRIDKNLDNGPLKLVGRAYEKGLGLHSQTRLVYRLAGKFRQFSAIAGIDDTIPSGGNVRLQVSGDGKPLWEGTIKGGEDPRSLEIDVTGVKRLELLVGFGDDLDVGDYLDLAEAKVSK